MTTNENPDAHCRSHQYAHRLGAVRASRVHILRHANDVPGRFREGSLGKPRWPGVGRLARAGRLGKGLYLYPLSGRSHG